MLYKSVHSVWSGHFLDVPQIPFGRPSVIIMAFGQFHGDEASHRRLPTGDGKFSKLLQDPPTALARPGEMCF